MPPFSQSKDTYKVFFYTKYCNINLWEELFIEDILNIFMYEIESQTVESLANDLWCYEIYLTTIPNLSIVIGEILNFANDNGLLVLDNNIQLEKIEDKDWVGFYQNQLKPIKIGRFFIGSYLHKNLCPNNNIGIFVEASRAFGTGSHETTAGCVEALELLSDLEFNNILDIGTGTGILAFAAEKLWPQARILACDIEEVSIEIAKDNAKFNNSRVNFYQNNVEQILSPSDTNFDLIVSNILSGPLISLAKQIKKISTPNCYLILSGFLAYQQEELIAAYQEIGFELKNLINKNSWIIITVQLTNISYQITNT